MIYAGIFFAKILEVSISTLRLVLMGKGHRLIASVLASIEVAIWLVITSTVLLGLSADPLKAVVYVLAVMVGINCGVLIEDKLALGLAQIEIIAEIDEAKTIVSRLREFGYRATTFECEGLDGKKLSIVLKVMRKDVSLTIGLIKDYNHLFVTVTDIKKLPIGIIGRQALRKTY